MDVLREIVAGVERGEAEEVDGLVARALATGVPPREVLDGGLLAGMSVVGDLFRRHEIFLPDVLLAARAMTMGLERLKPLLAGDGGPVLGRIVIGSVRGDLHDIGKNLVGILLKGAGIDVVDLGNDVAPERFVDAAVSSGAQVIGLSALLTTTMLVMREVVDLVEARGSAAGSRSSSAARRSPRLSPARSAPTPTATTRRTRSSASRRCSGRLRWSRSAPASPGRHAPRRRRDGHVAARARPQAGRVSGRVEPHTPGGPRGAGGPLPRRRRRAARDEHVRRLAAPAPRVRPRGEDGGREPRRPVETVRRWPAAGRTWPPRAGRAGGCSGRTATSIPASSGRASPARSGRWSRPAADAISVETIDRPRRGGGGGPGRPGGRAGRGRPRVDDVRPDAARVLHRPRRDRREGGGGPGRSRRRRRRVELRPRDPGDDRDRARVPAGDGAPGLDPVERGLPRLAGGRVAYGEDPAFMAEAAGELLDLGVAVIGGCCGTMPRTSARYGRRSTGARPGADGRGGRARPGEGDDMKRRAPCPGGLAVCSGRVARSRRAPSRASTPRSSVPGAGFAGRGPRRRTTSGSASSASSTARGSAGGARGAADGGGARAPRRHGLRPLLFAIHTYFALVLKLLVAGRLERAGAGRKGSVLDALATASDGEAREVLARLESGDLLAERGSRASSKATSSGGTSTRGTRGRPRSRATWRASRPRSSPGRRRSRAVGRTTLSGSSTSPSSRAS